jgi:hypothetical protein
MLGPFAAQMLGDYGADVIKIEAPEGDSTRRTGPATEQGMAATFLGANRNKRSIVLDLKQADGREALLKLTDTADVLLYSMRPKKLKSLGLAPRTWLEGVTAGGAAAFAARVWRFWSAQTAARLAASRMVSKVALPRPLARSAPWRSNTRKVIGCSYLSP